MAWMSPDFKNIEYNAESEISAVSDEGQLEQFRIKYFGRKGIFAAEIFSLLPEAPPDQKPALGKQANALRNKITAFIEERKSGFKQEQKKDSSGALDLTIPGVSQKVGHKHILTQIIEEICGLFENLGFVVQEGPEMETEFNNFTALNIPEDHPSRDGFDTFYLEAKDPESKEGNFVLRSHTSPGQLRIMKQYKPPLAVVIPGKVYRPDAVDASHSFMFHQIEGLLVNEDIKFSDLKGLLAVFLKRLFNEEIKTRFRPHFFPFTEPSAEVDISCYICDSKGCSACGGKGWLEIMGCGMVHPKVFEAVGYPKGKYTGLAFGLGVERLAMLKYGIHDIRLFFENDNRFLKQF